MESMKTILDGFEKLVYEILLWLILVPKTLAKIVSRPKWVPEYVAENFADTESTRFDGHISPVILLLLTSLVPFAIFDTLPLPGVSVEGPISGVVGKDYEFVAKANFKYPSEEEYQFTWSLTDLLSAGGGEGYADQVFPVQTVNAGWEVGDTPQNWYALNWDGVGSFFLNLSAANDKGEVYETVHLINIASAGTPVDETPMSFDERPTGGVNVDSIQQSLQGEAGIIAALIFMGLPLVFTMSVEMFRGREIAKTALRKSFYTQCYFFAPLNLSLWAVILYESHFYVEDLNDGLFGLITLLFLALLVWFVVNEIRMIRREREVGATKATLIFLVCIILILTISVLVLLVAGDPEFASVIWWGYVIAVLLAFVSGVFGRKDKVAPVE